MDSQPQTHFRTVRLRRYALVLAGAMVLAACDLGRAEPRTAADFVADTVAMDAKLLECRNDRKMAARDPECKAARQAAARLSAAQEAARRKAMEQESEAELSRLRRQQEARDDAAEQRQADLVRTAEAKLEQGVALTAEEARALGIDPESSVLVESDDD